MTLFEKIEKEIEREAERRNIYFPSDEEIIIEMQLNDEETEEFFNVTCSELVEAEHYEFDTKDAKLIVYYKYNE